MTNHIRPYMSRDDYAAYKIKRLENWLETHPNACSLARQFYEAELDSLKKYGPGWNPYPSTSKPQFLSQQAQ